jgi:hypothetical protein
MPREAWATLLAISWLVAACSSTAVAMVATISLTSFITCGDLGDLAHGVDVVEPWMPSIPWVFDLLGGLGGLLGQFLDLVGHHGEALAGLAGPGRLDGGVEGQQVGLFGDLGDGLGDLADLLRAPCPVRLPFRGTGGLRVLHGSLG